MSPIACGRDARKFHRILWDGKNPTPLRYRVKE